jgi:DNA-binding MarR family transcriptional regulator
MSTRSEQSGAEFTLDTSLGFLVAVLAKRMTGQFNAVLAEHGLTTTQWAVLAALWREDGQTQHELSRHTQIDAATLTEMLKRMAGRGLLRRERDPENNRYQRVYLTSPDRALRDQVTALAADVNARAVEGFSDGDRERFGVLLGRAVANLGDPVGPTAPAGVA